jgi:hypothetical protein
MRFYGCQPSNFAGAGVTDGDESEKTLELNLKIELVGEIRSSVA